jgi:hypothetical protein
MVDGNLGFQKWAERGNKIGWPQRLFTFSLNAFPTAEIFLIHVDLLNCSGITSTKSQLALRSFSIYRSTKTFDLRHPSTGHDLPHPTCCLYANSHSAPTQAAPSTVASGMGRLSAKKGRSAVPRKFPHSRRSSGRY